MFQPDRNRKQKCLCRLMIRVSIYDKISSAKRVSKGIAELGGADMAVGLSRLYKEIYAEYEVELLTESCFGKKISWVHMVEDKEFTYLLHGGELIFNSGLNYDSEEGLKSFIDCLLKAQAGGLVVAVQQKDFITKKIIDYCNRIQFPLFRASWQTSYLEIMHRFSEMIISDERNETNLIAALKNAIYYPKDDKLYRNHFERNGYFDGKSYVISVLGFHDSKKRVDEYWRRLEKMLTYSLPGSVVYQEQDMLVVLSTGYEPDELQEEFQRFCQKEPELTVAIGSVNEQTRYIHNSYENAVTTYNLAGTVFNERILCYDNLGIYQILTDRNDEKIYSAFVETTLGKLIEYDEENNTEYVSLLETFFANECNLTQTAAALFFHKNTLKYKMNAIREILGYDIMSNENRMNIMISLAILRMGKG